MRDKKTQPDKNTWFRRERGDSRGYLIKKARASNFNTLIKLSTMALIVILDL